MKTLHKTLILLLILLVVRSQTNAQSCTDSFTDTVTTITCSPYQTAFLSNGNIVVANYHSINGIQQLTVDLFNITQCRWTKSYLCPDVGLPDSRLQLLVSHNDHIYIKYTGSFYNNVIVLNNNLIEKQRFQPNKNGWPEMQIALDKAGNVIVLRKKYNAGHFEIYFEKYIDFNTLVFSSHNNGYTSNISISTIDAITIDKNNNYIASGVAQDLGTGVSYIYVTKCGRNGGLNFFKVIKYPYAILSKPKLTIDNNNNILVAVNVQKTNSVNAIFKFDSQGIQLWENQSKVTAFAENDFWMATDSNQSTYIIYNEETGNVSPKSVAVMVKYLSNGQKEWQRNYKYVNAKSILLKDANSLFIGGSKYLAQKDFPSYRPYWQLVNKDGDELDNGYDFYNVDSNTTLSYEGQFNQLVYNTNYQNLSAIGTRTHIQLNNTTTNYAFARSFDFNSIPKMGFENSPALNTTPNPASDFINIKSPLTKEILKITITTIDGKLVFEKANIDQENSIDIRDWKYGIYLVKMITPKGVLTNKFIKR
jgi:hypothetical protein